MTADLFMENPAPDHYLNNIARIAIPLMFILLWYGCNSVNDDTGSNPSPLPADTEWLIPSNEIFVGAGKDDIPSIDNPVFAPVDETDYVPDERRVVGVKIGDVIRAYPHQILDWHEIVNDQIGETAFAITFCPLTGTAICWNREVNGAITEFGTSGLLFRNNLVAYDRNTDSRWAQMQLRGVQGTQSNVNIETIELIETTWKTWKTMYPESEVITRDTGFERNYQGFTYGSDYSTNHSRILFPVNNSDPRLENKVRVHGVIADETASQDAAVRVYEIRKFGDGISIIDDQLGAKDIVVVGSSDLDFAVSFEASIDSESQLTFDPVQNALPVVMEDQEGNKWDIFGYAVEGPMQGEQLKSTRSYTGYWFAWADFFPGLEIYQN